MPRISHAKLIDGWKTLNSSLKALETKEPFVETCRQSLEADLVELLRLLHLSMRLNGKLRVASAKIGVVLARGKETESRLRALLKGTYGAKSAQLVQHGIKPRRGSRRVSRPLPDGPEIDGVGESPEDEP